MTGKGDIGYEGRNGWYMAAWLSQDCRAPTYQTWQGAEIASVMEAFGEMVDCQGSGFFGKLWCPRAGRLMKLRSLPYVKELQKQLILNNNLSMAIEFDFDTSRYS